MIVSLSAAALFGVLAFACIRGRTTGPGSALVLFLFGFFVAGTGASGPITQICAALAGAVTNL